VSEYDSVALSGLRIRTPSEAARRRASADAGGGAPAPTARSTREGSDFTLARARTNEHWLERYDRSLMRVFGTPQRVLVRGEGCYVWDADGHRYLDLLGGIAVNVLGHAHPFLVSAVTAQLATLGHVSNFFTTPLQVGLAERLLELLDAPPGSAVFFGNSGSEANEAALKLSRRTGRTGLVAAEGAFHGRTMGALALTHKPAYREPFVPLPGDVVHVPYGDLEALDRAVGDGTAAVFLEPIQGEAGVRLPPPGYLAAARERTQAAGALLVLDEVQTGIGRTGSWFAHQLPAVGGDQPLVPDVVTLAKGLGGGIPVSAVVAFGPANATRLSGGQHGTTFGGNPVATAAGLATLHVIERDGLLANATSTGDHLAAAIMSLAEPLIAEIRGHGLLRAVQFAAPVAAAVARHLLEAGFIVNAVTPDALRLAPPLILTPEQADTFVAALPAALAAAAKEQI
jgi:acetylornithine/N-succinyldiaminopimelate aminotransferase